MSSKNDKGMRSVIGWIGGKSQLRSKIISLFPNKIDMYVEVFGGAGWVLLGKSKHAKEEVYNDINGDLVNLFRCIKHHKDELKRELEFEVSAREVFYDYKDSLKSSTLTDIQRAARFFYLARCSFGTDLKSYATRGKSLSNSILKFNDLAKRLEKVVIENKSFENLIDIYDRKHTLFYLDPPYYGTEHYYNKGEVVFTKDSHLVLKNILKDIKGKFILSYNDCKEIRELYKDYKIMEVTRKTTLSATSNGKIYKELIITNY